MFICAVSNLLAVVGHWATWWHKGYRLFASPSPPAWVFLLNGGKRKKMGNFRSWGSCCNEMRGIVEIHKATPQQYPKTINRSGSRQPSGPFICESADFNIKVSVFSEGVCVEAKRSPSGLERGDVVNLW